MAVKIGHSSIDERGNIAGGAAGDSTGKEVCTRKWYNGRWNVVLRPKTSALAEKSAKACEAGCNNPNIGYDQNQRNTLNTKAKAVGYDLAKITEPCECDCSAFMQVCAIAGGAGLSYGSNGCTTRSMAAAFVKSGDYEKLTASKYLTSDKYLQRGDILVKEGSHTVMVLENGAAVTASTTTAPAPAQTATEYTLAQFVKDVQKAIGAAVDGVAGPETLRKTVTLSAKKNAKHAAVLAVQKRLAALDYAEVGKADGVAGPKFTSAVAHFQQDNGCEVDGEITAKCKTWRKLLGMR